MWEFNHLWKIIQLVIIALEIGLIKIRIIFAADLFQTIINIQQISAN